MDFFSACKVFDISVGSTLTNDCKVDVNKCPVIHEYNLLDMLRVLTKDPLNYKEGPSGLFKI